MTCRHVGRGLNRLLTSHLATCETATCPGCAPCPERHCQVCTHRHVTVDGRGTDQTCATCLGETRTRIGALVTMSAALLGEALRRGINSHAAALAGPVADPEVWSYRRLSVLGQRIDPRWLEDQVDLLHPAWILGTWERETRIHLGQTVSPGTSKPTLTEAASYLTGHLTRLAHDETFAFGEMADDIRTCHNHVERVLALDEHHEIGAPCPSCGNKAGLEKVYADTENGDKWTCGRCHQWWTELDYRAKVSGTYLAVAQVLTASQIREQYRVREGTVRQWVLRKKVRTAGRDDKGRQLYVVSDVLAARDARAAS